MIGETQGAGVQRQGQEKDQAGQTRVRTQSIQKHMTSTRHKQTLLECPLVFWQ